MDCNCQKCGGKIENNDYFLIGFYINKNYTQMRMICKECAKKMKGRCKVCGKANGCCEHTSVLWNFME